MIADVFKRALVIYRPTPTCLEKAEKIVAKLREKGLSVNSFWVDDLIKDMKIKSDIVFSVGGDGTLLKISRVFQDTTPLIIPIPCGRRTILYEKIDDDMIEEVIDRIMDGYFTIQVLGRINAVVNNKSYKALNELLLISADRGRVIGFRITIKTPSTESKFYLEGDGILIGASTGSAAYNLSARGPLIDYFEDSMFITPLNPMELDIAPLVVPCIGKIYVETTGFVEVYMDGERIEILGPNRQVSVEYGEGDVRIIRFSPVKNFVKDVFEKRRTIYEE